MNTASPGAQYFVALALTAGVVTSLNTAEPRNAWRS